MSDEQVKVTLTQISDYSFNVSFDETDIPDLVTDEGAPLGGGKGPNPSRMLMAAIANCLSASLLFAMRKYKNAPGTIRAEVRGTLGRKRVLHVDVDLHLPDAADSYAQFERILQQFENFCVVTESVRSGIEVAVQVRDGSSTVLHSSVNQRLPA
jgi:organic hydroperoxide reductase OsmC/OhrA